MSGIAAIFTFDGSREAGDIRKMVAAAAHRSSSGTQSWETDNGTLTHLRSHELMGEDDRYLASSSDGQVAVVADARIDNRHDLARDLDILNLEQSLPGDAALILAAYRKWGSSVAERLIGDFAFVIWDERSRSVLAARDPMGMRPLYLRIEPHRRVLFASEAKQILAASGVPRRVNEQALAHHLLNRFDPLDWSFHEGIDVLAPGHTVTVDQTGTRTWQHWHFDPGREIVHAKEEDYVEHFREIVIEAGRARLRASRPIGVLLSGGMDSGTEAGVAAWLGSGDSERLQEVIAYTWDFGDLRDCDERHISRHLIEHFDITEHEIPVAHLGPLAGYPMHGPDMDTPFLGSFQPALERSLEVAADDGCGLVMSGDRGDLVSGALIVNYPHMLRRREWRQLGRQLRRHRVATGEGLGTILLRDMIAPVVRRLRRWPDRSTPTPTQPFPQWLQPGFVGRTGIASGLREIEYGGEPIPDYYREQRRRLILEPMHMRGMIWTNRTHARAGLGFADIWSDRRLAEFVVAISQQAINRPGRNDKQMVKKAMVGILPDSFLAAADKVLPTPLYRRGLFTEGAATVRDLFQGSRAAALGYIDDGEALAAYERARRGGSDAFPIWRTICVEMWLRAHWS